MIIREIRQKKDLEELYELRYCSWSTRISLEKYFPHRRLEDKYDVSSIHWGVYAEGILRAGASMYMTSDLHSIPYVDVIAPYLGKPPEPYYLLRRLVVSPVERNRGLAAALDRTRIKRILEHEGGTALVVVSQKFRAKMLARYGLEAACHLGDFKTFPGGDSILLLAKCQDLYIPKQTPDINDIVAE